ncbi:MAG: D-amino-acid oxidase [Verrucomicrobiota bacterium]
MNKKVAVIGAGVSGLTSAIVFAERGYRTSIFAHEVGQQTTSAAAGAIWYPYDAEPFDKVIAWALATYKVLVDLARDPRSGVSMIEQRNFARTGQIPIPDWATPLGARRLNQSVIPSEVEESRGFTSCFTVTVPLTDTTIYLDYLRDRFLNAGGEINAGVRFDKLEDVDPKFDLIINCAGIGARELVHDVDLEPHRGQVAIVPKIDNLNYAVVCDDAPLMYAIPRANDCLFGGTNEVSEDRHIDPVARKNIVTECSRVLKIDNPRVIVERVGLRPFRKSGVRVEAGKLRDGRIVIHNYGHGGAGFTLSWGCAENVLAIAKAMA